VLPSHHLSLGFLFSIVSRGMLRYSNFLINSVSKVSPRRPGDPACLEETLGNRRTQVVLGCLVAIKILLIMTSSELCKRNTTSTSLGKRDCQASLVSGFVVYLCGHNHDTAAQNVVIASAPCPNLLLAKSMGLVEPLQCTLSSRIWPQGTQLQRQACLV
jgi:hypothetical protein